MATYEIISATKLTGSTATIDLTSIAQTYTDLRLVVKPISSGAASYNLFMKVNSSAANYSNTYYYNSTTALASGNLFLSASVDGFRNTQNTLYTFDFMSYSSTSVHKTIIVNIAENNYCNGKRFAKWGDTTAISSINLYTDAGNNFAVGTQIALYGIKAA